MQTRLHWNYFLALERDLQAVSRYIEFCQPNMQVFSIELAHLLFAAASEVDTVAKCVCQLLDPKAECENINHYRSIIQKAEDEQEYASTPGAVMLDIHKHKISTLQVIIPHCSIEFIPWESWAKDTNPDWWHSYNKVKHQRNDHFNEATLHNSIYALGALLVMNYVFCRMEITKDNPKLRYHYTGISVTRHLTPDPVFIRLKEHFYENIRHDLE